MYLIINNEINRLFLGLADSKQKILNFETKKMEFGAGEKLLFFVHNFLKKNKIKPKKLEGIIVNRGLGSFTSLRLSCLLANAWAYMNQKKRKNFIEPIYGKEPNISQPKNKTR